MKIKRMAVRRQSKTTLFEAMRESKAGAIAAIGLRSWQARNAQLRGIREYRDRRWDSIVAMSKTGFPAVTQQDYEPFNIGEPKPKFKRREFNQKRWDSIVALSSANEVLQKHLDQVADKSAEADVKLLSSLELLTRMAVGPRSKNAERLTV